MSQTPSNPPPRVSPPLSNRRAMGLVVLIWLAGLGSAAQYGKVSIGFDLVALRYPEAGNLLGFALSLIGFVGIALGVIAGILGARIGMRRCLIGGFALGAIVSALQVTGLSFNGFLASRIVEGMSHLAIVVSAPTLIARVAPDRWRGFAMTLWGTFFGVAFSLLAWLGLPFAQAFGVEALFAGHAVWMAVSAVALALVNLPEGSGAAPAAVRLRDLPAKHLAIYRSPHISAAGVGWLFYTFCYVSLLTLLPSVIPPAWLGFTLVGMPLMSILGSLTLGVYLLRYTSAVGISVIGFLSTGMVVFGLILWPGAPVLCLLMGFTLGLVQGSGFGIVPALNDSEADRALANGAMAQTGNLGNTIGTPILLIVAGGAGYAGMMAVALAVLLLGALAHLGLAQLRRRVA